MGRQEVYNSRRNNVVSAITVGFAKGMIFRMDLAVLLGIGGGLLSLILGFMWEGGHVGSLIQKTAALIVFGGTIGVTVACFSVQDLKVLPQILKNALTMKLPEESEIIDEIVNLADQARREGLLYLEDQISTMDNEFLRKGIQLVIDGTESELVRNIMETEIISLEERYEVGAGFFEAAGGFAPTMGIIGTVMGLVHVLGNLEDPTTLGPKIAVAFIATLYGVGSANIFYLPLAGKIKNVSKKEVIIKELIMEGVIALQGGNNPLLIRERLNAYLNPNNRPPSKKPNEED